MKLFVVSLVVVAACTRREDPIPWERFAQDEVCAAYVGHKTLLMFAQLPVMGTACGLSLRIAADNGLRQAIVELPSKALRSGNAMRDAAVQDALGGNEQALVVFTATLPHNSLPEMMPGMLTVRGRTKPLSVRLTREPDGALRVVAVTGFEELGLDAPRLAGGLVIAASDDLTLYARVPSARLPQGL